MTEASGASTFYSPSRAYSYHFEPKSMDAASLKRGVARLMDIQGKRERLLQDERILVSDMRLIEWRGESQQLLNDIMGHIGVSDVQRIARQGSSIKYKNLMAIGVSGEDMRLKLPSFILDGGYERLVKWFCDVRPHIDAPSWELISDVLREPLLMQKALLTGHAKTRWHDKRQVALEKIEKMFSLLDGEVVKKEEVRAASDEALVGLHHALRALHPNAGLQHYCEDLRTGKDEWLREDIQEWVNDRPSDVVSVLNAIASDLGIPSLRTSEGRRSLKMFVGESASMSEKRLAIVESVKPAAEALELCAKALDSENAITLPDRFMLALQRLKGDAGNVVRRA